MTFDIDMTADAGKKPGKYLAEVSAVKVSYTKNSECRMVLTFKDCADGEFLCDDGLMMEGKGWNMARAKLIALGMNREHKGPFNELDLIGKRAYLHVETREWQGQMSLQPDAKAGGHCGYWMETEPPPDFVAAAKAVTTTGDLDVPF